MREIGRVQFVQIQRSSLKLGNASHEYYDPAALLRSDHLAVSAAGAFAVMPDESYIVDIHNAMHPHTRHNRDSDNGLSVGFTSHYQAMREQFGAHLTDGIAGENIIIETARRFSLADLGDQIAFQNPVSGQVIRLNVPKMAAPCTPFSQFCMCQPDLGGQPLKETLQFLHNGMRGFLVALPDMPYATINAGDRMLINDEFAEGGA